MSGYCETYDRIFTELEKRFYVESLLTERSKMIFILESPHIQELKHGAPVSGSSGATMSRHLFGPKYQKPLGLLCKKNVEENKERPALDVIGLMNVCGIPMQKKAYNGDPVLQQHGEFFSVLEGVRQNNQTFHYRDARWEAMQAVIVGRFRKRLEKLAGKKCVVIPCGRFSQKFFRLTGVRDKNWRVIANVPHPSYNSWSRKKYAATIAEVKRAFSQLREEQVGGNAR